MKGIWVTWEFQRRNEGISASIGFPLYQIEVQSSRLLRYLKSAVATFKAIKKERPEIVVSQNPSIFLAIFTVLYSKVGKYYPVIDAHNSGIYPFEGKVKAFNIIAAWLQRKAFLTIVTNLPLKHVVQNNGGRAFVLPDAIPRVPVKLKQLRLNGKYNLVSICTFSDDEPYKEIIAAAQLLPDDVHIYITGRFEGKVNIKDLPRNVHLTGFVPEQEYWDLLYSAHVIMDLTYRENCLVCGAYEGVALEKPLILSNTAVLKEYFSKGCVYSNPEKLDIHTAILESIKNIGQLQEAITELREEISSDWCRKIVCLMEMLNKDVSKSRK